MQRHRATVPVPARGRARSFARRLLAPLLVASLATTLAACGTEGPPGEGYEIIGFVVESVGTGDDGPPIAGAMVRFETDTGRVTEGVSESNGRYRLFIVSDTRFGEISAIAPGFQEGRETVFFDAPSRRVDLVLPREGEMP